MFDTIIDASNITDTSVLTTTAIALAIGIVMAVAYYFFGDKKSKGFMCALMVLPVIVQAIITVMLAVGSMVVGLATFGVFSLVKFRSMPGTAKDIAVIFCEMAIGVLLGMGYAAYAAVIAVIVIAVFAAMKYLPIPEHDTKNKRLKIVVPENVDYSKAFEEIFSEYTAKCELVKIKTTDLGSLFDLTYEIRLKSADLGKKLIDDLRIRNGNLPVILCSADTDKDSL